MFVIVVSQRFSRRVLIGQVEGSQRDLQRVSWLVESRYFREIDATRVLIDWSDRVVAEMSATGFDWSGRGVAERHAACM